MLNEDGPLYPPDESSQKVEETPLKRIFLNIFVIFFIIVCYFSISEVFGSISTSYISENSFNLTFGFTLFTFVLFSVLSGPIRGSISGFIGELLYQLAYYENLNLAWCFIIGSFGLLVGLYKYKPLKYKEGIKVYYTFVELLVSSAIISLLIVIFYSMFSSFALEDIILNYGFNFFMQCLISVIILVPFSVFLYDYALARKESHIYLLLLTHHPVSQSDHTFFFKFGRTYVYFCSRCSGMIIGVIFSMSITNLIFKIDGQEISPELALLCCIILPIPGLIDWGTQRLGLRKSSTESRLFTGFIIGNALHFLSLTKKYSFFMLFIVILYFTVFGLLMFFGERRARKRFEEEYKISIEKDQDEILP